MHLVLLHCSNILFIFFCNLLFFSLPSFSFQIFFIIYYFLVPCKLALVHCHQLVHFVRVHHSSFILVKGVLELIMIVTMFEKPIHKLDLWNGVGQQKCGFKLEWTIIEEKNPTIWFLHFVVKLLQPFLEQNFNHPCFFIPLIQEIEFFFIDFFIERMCFWTWAVKKWFSQWDLSMLLTMFNHFGSNCF
jgi:hypothetical protein